PGDYDATRRWVFQLAGLPIAFANGLIVAKAGVPEAEYFPRYPLMLLYTLLYAVLGAMLIFARTGPLEAVTLTNARAAAWDKRQRGAFFGRSRRSDPSA